MKRFPLALAAVCVLAALAVGLTRRDSAAQDASPTALAGHPLVGAWFLDVDTDDDLDTPALVTFTSDGIYTQADHDGTAGIGSWEATGSTTAGLTFFQQFHTEGNFAGRTTIRAEIEVAADGQNFSAAYTLEYSGDIAPEGEVGPVSASGERIMVEPMGTPVMSLAEMLGEPEAGAGTPEVTPAP